MSHKQHHVLVADYLKAPSLFVFSFVIMHSSILYFVQLVSTNIYMNYLL